MSFITVWENNVHHVNVTNCRPFLHVQLITGDKERQKHGIVVAVQNNSKSQALHCAVLSSWAKLNA